MTAKAYHRSKHKASFLLFVIIVACASAGGVLYHRLKEPLPSLMPQLITPISVQSQTVRLGWPDTGQAAIGVSGFGVLATGGTQTPAPTASIAKLITALAVLKVKPLTIGSQGPIITLTQNDVNIYNHYTAEDGSVALVAAGEQIYEYQLIEGMLLPSANNMADSLADWAFGSLGAYKTYANHMLASLGLNNTHIGSDASGFLPDTTATAYDLVKIGEIAEANPIIAGIVSQRNADLPIAGTVNNVNWLLGSYGINGLKTGNSNQAGGTFLFSAPYIVASGQKVTIIGAIMQSPTLQKAMDSTLPLLTTAQKAVRYSVTLKANQAIGQYIVPWSDTVTVITKHDVQSLTWQGAPLYQPISTLSVVRAPKPKGAIVGTIKYLQSSSDSPVILSQSITKPSIWWRIFH